ncbi:MAG: RNA polymerase sigma factor [Phycisphaeraceae bacterium]|nr:RNA polymerase sigma factor [Phycisphaeraceae bacterium]
MPPCAFLSMVAQAAEQTRPDRTDATWQELSDRLRRCALALARSHAAADDLAQETWKRVLETRPDMASHEGYLIQTLTRLWLNQQRTATRRLARLVSYARSRAPRVTGRSNDTTRVERAIATLPTRQRAVLVLRAVMGLEIQAIAASLEIDARAVRASLHLARRAVRAAAGGDL